jgi:hypothetical protein
VPADSGYVLVRGDRIDVLFPRVPIEQLECVLPASSYETPIPPRLHAYAWSVGWQRADTIAEHASMAGMMFASVVSLAIAPTFDRLDSTFARVALRVIRRESRDWWPLPNQHDPAAVRAYFARRGSRPTAVAAKARSPTEPDLRAIYFDHGRLHVAMKGIDARDSLLMGSRDTLTLSWCARTSTRNTAVVPVVRG